MAILLTLPPPIMRVDGNYEQWLYYRELRINRLERLYSDCMCKFKDFYADTNAIELKKMIDKLKESIPSTYND